MSQRSAFLRFLRYVQPYWKYVLGGAIGGVVKFTVPLLVPQVTQHLIDNVYLSDTLSRQAQVRELAFYLGGLAAIFVIVWTPMTYMRHYYTAKARQHAMFDLRRDLYQRVLRMSASFFDHNHTGSILARLISDVQQAQKLVGSALTNIWMDAAAIIVVVFFLLSKDVPTTLVALSTMPIYLYVFNQLRSRIRRTSHEVQESIAELSGNAQEKIAGSTVIHAFTQEHREERHFFHDAKRVFTSYMRRAYYQAMNMGLTGLLTNLSPLIVLAFGGYRVITNQMTVGELVAVNLYLTPLYTPLKRFSQLNVVFANSMAAIERVFDVMDVSPDVKDRPDAIELDRIVGKIEFDHVSFAYPQDQSVGEENHIPSDSSPASNGNGPQDSDKPTAATILDDVSFVAQPGEQIALVGPSGAGKSTLVTLLPRFYDVTAGSVQIDEYDVRSVTKDSLRHNISMVMQEPILFSGSVRDNMRYGRPDASEQELIEACKAANAYDFIQRLPDGLETEVGENGKFLSGGQRQRLTIGRAFLKDPKILILDEATSSLDAESERLVQNALQRLMEDRTTIIIAHRLSTIVDADRILVLDDGKVVGMGTHVELLQQDGLYRELYDTFEAATLGANAEFN